MNNRHRQVQAPTASFTVAVLPNPKAKGAGFAAGTGPRETRRDPKGKDRVVSRKSRIPICYPVVRVCETRPVKYAIMLSVRHLAVR